jgi:hypothetical protein
MVHPTWFKSGRAGADTPRMDRRVRGRVVVAALAVGLLPTAALAAPPLADRWNTYRENREVEAFVRRAQPAIDALHTVAVPGLAPCPGHPGGVLRAACLGSDTLAPLDVAAKVRDELRAVGATGVEVRCTRTRTFVHCNVTGSLKGVAISGYVAPRLAPGRLYGVEVMLQPDVAPGLVAGPEGGTPVPLP